MKTPEDKRKKRSQRDYNLGFKLGVVSRVESGEMTYKQAQRSYGIQGRSTVLTWLRKHGTLDWTKPIVHSMKNPKLKETPAQQIKRLEKELADEKLKNSIMNSMVDVFDKQYGAGLRKKFLPEQSLKNNKKEE
jgi:transposase-like protein